MRVSFSYLDRQFEDVDRYLQRIRRLVQTGDFTLGAPLVEFERRFAELCRLPHAIGVGTGTDALALPLKLLDLRPGDEVITCANTFVATVGAIVQAGGKPVFVDSEDGFVIDPDLIEDAITERTRAIVPVHYTGNVADMPRIAEIARRHDLAIVEDACQAIGAEIDGKPVGSWGIAAAFSLHPLKNLNVWGDGGVIVTRDDALAEKLRLYRNHGLKNRDEIVMWGVNSRLDTLQAVVGNELIDEVPEITRRRIEIAKRYDEGFAELKGQIDVPVRRRGVKHVYHLYVVRARERDALLESLTSAGVEAKIHYPIPLPLQAAARELGHQPGDFPVCEADAERVVTLPAHQHLTDEEIAYTIQQVRAFSSASRRHGA